MFASLTAKRVFICPAGPVLRLLACVGSGSAVQSLEHPMQTLNSGLGIRHVLN